MPQATTIKSFPRAFDFISDSIYLIDSAVAEGCAHAMARSGHTWGGDKLFVRLNPSSGAT